MADILDIAQERGEIELARALESARLAPSVSAFICENCDAPIPEARRNAFPGVTRCISCQQFHEADLRHFRK